MKILSPELGWLILGLPVLWFLFLFSHKRSLTSLRRLGYPKTSPLVQKFLIRNFMRLVFISGIYLFSLLAIVDFYWGVEPVNNDKRNLDVAIVLDVSHSMLAQDVGSSRLDRCLDGIYLLMENLKHTRFSFTLFKGSAQIFIPLTEDLVALENLLPQINTAMLSAPGSNLEEALLKALSTLPENQERNRAIMLFSDGESLTGNSMAVVRELYKSNIQLFTFGVGTEEGEQITFSDGEIILDELGEPVITRQNREVMMKMAEMTGGSYLDLSQVHLLGEMERTLVETYQFIEARGISFEETRRYRIFVIFVLVFLLLYMIVGKMKWN